jgi:hypothetical protein
MRTPIEVSALAISAAFAACGKPAPPAPKPASPQRAPAPAAAVPPTNAAGDPARLPEDPLLAARATAEWREHMEREERERQQGFDRSRLAQHRALVKKIRALRARLDRAGNDRAVATLAAAMPAEIEGLRQRVTEIDHWGTNSRLLPDYAALIAALSNPYLEAKRSGDTRALEALHTEFDRRLSAIDAWLKEAAEDGKAEERPARN